MSVINEENYLLPNCDQTCEKKTHTQSYCFYVVLNYLQKL